MCVLRGSQWHPQMAHICSMAAEGNGTLLSAGSGTSLPRNLGEAFSGGGREMTEYMAGVRTERNGKNKDIS